MDSILNTLLSWQFIVFGLAVAAALFVLRRLVEYCLDIYFKVDKQSKLYKFWTELLLPILPMLLGSGGAVAISTFPYPNDLTTTGSRFVFGLVAGLMSGLFYRIIKSVVANKLHSLKKKDCDQADSK
jgi:hypothetical protein